MPDRLTDERLQEMVKELGKYPIKIAKDGAIAIKELLELRKKDRATKEDDHDPTD